MISKLCDGRMLEGIHEEISEVIVEEFHKIKRKKNRGLVLQVTFFRFLEPS